METKDVIVNNLPVAMLEAIDEIVRDESLGFADRDEFMREAIRVMISQYG